MPASHEAPSIILDPLSKVVRNIKGNLGMPVKARPGPNVSAAAKDPVGHEENIDPSAW